MALILPSQSLVLNAYAVLVNETPGSAALNEHLAFINANGANAYKLALDSIFTNYSTADLAATMLTNLGLSSIFTQADAEAYLNANSSDRVGAMIDLGTALYQYSGTDASLLAAESTYKAEIASSYAYSSVATNVTGKSLDSGTGGPTGGQTILLTTGLDVLTGTSSADTFQALVVQNTDGHQTNQLATGDQLHGGGGIDQLLATVQTAAALGQGYWPGSFIMPTTDGIEKAEFTALSVGTGYSGGMSGSYETVGINAKNMLGLTEVGSVQSDASLFIENLTTLTDSGDYAARRNTEAVKVRMDHTGNDNAGDQESNLTVLFDNDYLLAGKSTSDNAYYFLEDREGAAANAGTPLHHINTDGLVFSVDGVTKVISLTSQQMADFQANDGTWAGYTALMQAALAEAALTDPSLAGLTLNLSTTIFRTIGLDGTTLPLPAPALVLSSDTNVIQSLGFHNQSDAVGQYDVFAVISNEEQATQNLPVTVDVSLFKVGRGAEGGALTIGGMSTNFANTWNYSASAIKEGVEQFNITVEGDKTQMSSLSTVRSTNNTLQIVNVTSAAGSNADLWIGNHNSGSAASDAMKDVKTFDSTTFAGDLHLTAGFTSEMSAKYGTGDLSVTYTTGVGNDTLNLNVGESSSQQIDYHVATGEGNDTINMVIDGDSVDAVTESLAIDAGNGDNTISVAVVDTANGAHIPAGNDVNGVDRVTTDTLKNLNIVSGSGADKVTVAGVGDFDIFTGAGSDMVYIAAGGATGTNHLWTADGNVAGIATPEWINGIALYHAKLEVRFAGFESTVDIQTGTGAMTDIATQMDINNAVIAAIKASPELTRLVTATIGTFDQDLILKTLVDGVNPFEVTIFQPQLVASAPQGTQVVVSSGDVTALEAALVHTGRAVDSAEVVGQVADGVTVTAADVAAYFNDTAAGTLNAATSATGPFTFGGADNLDGTYQYYNLANLGTSTVGAQANDSVINMGSGSNDLVVLSTEATSVNTVVFNATWGKVSVVNFFDAESTSLATPNGGVATPAEPGAVMVDGLHQLDFTAFLTNTVSSSGSVLSELPIPITVVDNLNSAGTATSFTANDIVFANVDSLEMATTTATNLSFATLTDAQVQAALNSVGGFGAASQFQVAGTVPNDVVQTTRTSLLFVENVDAQDTNAVEDPATNTSNLQEIIQGTANATQGVTNTSYANYGDYKVYQVTYADTATDAVVAGSDAGFTVKLIGEIDFGNSLELTNLHNNLVGAVHA